VVKTKYWHELEDCRVQCDVCPRACKLKEGQQGLCFVRECRDHQIVLTSYGRSSGFCIDPIEKKPLNHFLPGTPVLSFGTAGCNLACKFCQNWESIGSQQACGCMPMRGLLQIARNKHLKVKTLDLRNSGDTAGTKDRVVGYGAYSVN